MSGKSNLLIVGDYNRRDYLDMFWKSRKDFNFFFLEFTSKKEVTNLHYKNYGKALFWGDYKNVYDLLEQIKPKKVLFFFIESYFHVVLNLACKSLCIPTYLIDHGIKDVNINLRFEKSLIEKNSFSSQSNASKKLTQFFSRVRTRLFLIRSVKLLPSSYAAFFRQYYSIRRNNHFLETWKKVASPLRVADSYISFSPKVYEVHKHYDHLPNDKKVHFIGLPNYDHLAGLKSAKLKKPQIIFLDQGLAIRRYFNWEKVTYQQFVTTLASICHTHGYTLLVKLHPIQPETDAKLWASFHNVKLIDNEELTSQLPHTNLIIGFYSTYLLPLMALPFTTVVTLENHPMGRIDVSKSFTDAGVAEPIYDLEELHDILQNIKALHQKQLPHKAQFIEEWMYKFDGRAGDRLRNILLSDNI